MNRKGFTLIELLAVIAILSVLGIIVIPIISDIIKDNKDTLYQTQIKNIESATSNYVSENFLSIDIPNNTTKGIHLSYLKNNGYVDKDISNPNTYEKFSDDLVILITNTNNDYTYTVCTSDVVCDTDVVFLDR